MALDLRFGIDYSTFRPDGTYGLTYRRIYGPRIPLERVARRWLTNRGDLFWAPNAGYNVSRLQNAKRPLSQLNLYAALLKNEAKQVNFVADATVQIQYVGVTLTVNGYITLTTGGTFPLNVGASQAGAVIVQFPSS